jgi:hypothetical protein
MNSKIGLILFAAAMGVAPVGASVDCLALSVAVKHAASANQSAVLELVAKEVSLSPECACEVVKAAIEGVNADAKTVAAIVQAAATVAPEQMRLISQCAVATAPDSLAEVQAVIARLDPNLGESAGAKSAKSGKEPAGEVAAMPNPLDFPGQGPVGPTPGGPGGSPLIPTRPPINVIPPVTPPGPPPVVPPLPPVTSINPPGPPVSTPPVQAPSVQAPPIETPRFN